MRNALIAGGGRRGDLLSVSRRTIFPFKLYTPVRDDLALRKVRDRGTRSPARETCVLPRLCEHSRSYSPSRWRNCADAYSRLSFAMKLALIMAGHTASHS